MSDPYSSENFSISQNILTIEEAFEKHDLYCKFKPHDKVTIPDDIFDRLNKVLQKAKEKEILRLHSLTKDELIEKIQELTKHYERFQPFIKITDNNMSNKNPDEYDEIEVLLRK